MEKSFTNHNTREHIAHLLSDAEKAILSPSETVESVVKYINAAMLLINQVLKDEKQ